MAVSKFHPTNFSNQVTKDYLQKIDGNMEVIQRLAVMFAPHKSNRPNMTITLDSGHIFNGTTLIELPIQVTSLITAPQTNSRIDRVVVSKSNGTVFVITGIESEYPMAPTIPSGYAPVAQILLTVGHQKIINTDITDERNLTAFTFNSASPNDNILINGQFAIAQRGSSGSATFNANSAYKNNDNSYTIDRWVLLSDGNNVAEVSQESSILPISTAYAGKLMVTDTNKKFGLLQVIEHYNSSTLIGNKVSLSFDVCKSNMTSSKLRAAVLTWNGSIDHVTRDVVENWETSGENPSLATNWHYENIPFDITLEENYQKVQIENIVIDTNSAKNLAVFIWLNDENTSLNNQIYLSNVKLERGTKCTNFIPLSFAEELSICQRYYYKSYNLDIAPSTPSMDGAMYQRALSHNSGEITHQYTFPTTMRKTPTVLLRSPAGTLNRIGTSISTSGEVAAATIVPGQRGVVVLNSGAVVNGNSYFSFITADAEL